MISASLVDLLFKMGDGKRAYFRNVCEAVPNDYVAILKETIFFADTTYLLRVTN
jgi:hypothetical protein